MLAAVVILVFQAVSAAVDIQAVAFKAKGTPCCVDTLMPGVCKALYNRDRDRFANSCRTNPDFSFIQCCYSCHFHPDIFTAIASQQPVPVDLYKEDAINMLETPNPALCFDRHGSAFCEAFVTRSGVWSRSAVNCDHSAFAFRVCRRTCGYCSGSKAATAVYNAAVARNQKECLRLF